MKKTIAIASILAALAGPALAQPDPHHPDQNPVQGTMGQGMMWGQNMMWGQGMMGPGMMGQGMMNCPLMGGAMMGYGNPHTEGRIAFLKAELKITDAQEKVWKAYADSLRTIDQRRASSIGMMGSGTMGPGMMGQGVTGPAMMQQGATVSAPEALENRVQLAETHLKNLKDLQAATKKLYRDLDQSQKLVADGLLGMPCGMGPM